MLDELDLDPAEEEKVRTPVGLDIGARTAEEIALSILASVVKAVRREGLVARPRGESGSDTATATTAVDPICGMTVVAGPPTLSLDVDGLTYWFCAAGCRDQFAERASASGPSAPPG